jgi:hypothetical protein
MVRARLAGAKIDDQPSRRKTKDDAYGEILDRRKRFKEMDEEFSRNPEKKRPRRFAFQHVTPGVHSLPETWTCS